MGTNFWKLDEGYAAAAANTRESVGVEVLPSEQDSPSAISRGARHLICY